jgi:hypothetical protein
MLGGGREPGARFVRNTRTWPLLKREDEGVLGKILGQVNVAHDSSESGNDLGRFNPPDRFDRAMDLRRLNRIHAFDGLLKPLILRTNWYAAAWTSSSVTGGSKLNNVLMFLHISIQIF